MRPLSILTAGMVTPLGLDAASTCAAMRAGLASFDEVSIALEGEAIFASAIPSLTVADPLARLVALIAPAIRACLAHAEPASPADIPLLIGVAEPHRPGRARDVDRAIVREIEAEMGVRLHASSRALPLGRVAGARAMALAAEMVDRDRRPLAIVAGVDSLVDAATIEALAGEGRVIRVGEPDGFIPGEAGAAVLVAAPGWARHRGESEALLCTGAGFGHEAATVTSGEPLRARGLTAAIRAALADAGTTFADVDYRISDENGEQYAAKEAAIAVARASAGTRDALDRWLIADTLGEIGAAVVPVAIGAALCGARKAYAPGPRALVSSGADGGERAALVLEAPSLVESLEVIP